MKSWVCERCGAEKDIPQYINTAALDTCQSCGTPHTVSRSYPATAIPPLLEDFGTQGLRISPWYQGKYRPYRSGVYECEFDDGTTVLLEWSGRAWMWGQYVVQQPPLLVKWRGCWQPSEIGRTESYERS